MNNEDKKKINELEKESFLDEFANNLRKEIDKQKITVEYVSKKSKIPLSTLNSYINGESTSRKLPNALNIKKIANALNCSTDYLLHSESDNKLLPIFNPTVETVLMNLYIVIKQANLNIVKSKKDIDTLQIDKHTIFYSSNQYIQLFFEEIKKYLHSSEIDDIYEVEEICKHFSPLKVYRGNIVDEILYDNCCKNEFISNGTINGQKTAENFDEIPWDATDKVDISDINEEVNIRTNIWNEKYSLHRKRNEK